MQGPAEDTSNRRPLAGPRINPIVVAAGPSWIPAAPGFLDDLRWRYRFVRSASSSPLRDDLERCEDELTELIQTARTSTDPEVMALAVEMVDRQRRIAEALRAGCEV